MIETDHRDDAELRQEALAKVRHLVSGMATYRDVEDIRRWREQNSAHESAFAFATRLWGRLGPAGRNFLDREGEQALPVRSLAASQRLTRRALFGGAGAVTATAVCLAVRPPFQLWPSVAEFGADYRTAIGEQRRIALADGASMQLNTRTSVKLRGDTGENERIELISGEAAIATGQKLTKPLVVIAGIGRISSPSATFNVRYDGDASCVTCLEGTVRVERADTVMVLEAEHQITYREREVGAPLAIDRTTVAAWQDGLLVFHQTPLSDVVAEINRYRSGKILVLSTEMGRRPVNARFRIGNVDGIMALVERTFGAKVTYLPGGFVVLS